MKPRYQRYQKKPELKKSQWLKLRITQSDKTKLTQNAKHTGLSLSEYLIICGLRRKLPIVDASTSYSLRRIMYEFKQVSDNFEQLTKTCHLNQNLGEPVVVDNNILLKLEHTLKEVQQMMSFFEQINLELKGSAG